MNRSERRHLGLRRSTDEPRTKHSFAVRRTQCIEIHEGEWLVRAKHRFAKPEPAPPKLETPSAVD